MSLTHVIRQSPLCMQSSEVPAATPRSFDDECKLFGAGLESIPL